MKNVKFEEIDHDLGIPRIGAKGKHAIPKYLEAMSLYLKLIRKHIQIQFHIIEVYI